MIWLFSVLYCLVTAIFIGLFMDEYDELNAECVLLSVIWPITLAAGLLYVIAVAVNRVSGRIS